MDPEYIAQMRSFGARNMTLQELIQVRDHGVDGAYIAGMAQAQDIQVSPHCSVGPVALCAAVHFDWSTSNVTIQEDFGEYDVPWRDDLVCGWNPVRSGAFVLPEKPGLGIELNTGLFTRHPYKKNAFPSLWDKQWLEEFTRNEPAA